jgi:hypothetical protein
MRQTQRVVMPDRLNGKASILSVPSIQCFLLDEHMLTCPPSNDDWLLLLPTNCKKLDQLRI